MPLILDHAHSCENVRNLLFLKNCLISLVLYHFTESINNWSFINLANKYANESKESDDWESSQSDVFKTANQMLPVSPKFVILYFLRKKSKLQRGPSFNYNQCTSILKMHIYQQSIMINDVIYQHSQPI